LSGRVYFVGAGPGDPALMTRKGLEVLRSCDVIVSPNELVSPALVEEAPPEAQRIGRHIPTIVEHARAGRTVVLLVPGDPLSFLGGSSDAIELVHQGVDVEVVPGVSPIFSLPGQAGIALTRTVTVTSGVGDDAIVLLSHSAEIRPAVERMIRDGRSPDQAAAAIEWGAAEPRVERAPLSEIAHRVAAWRRPFVVVVGEVAATDVLTLEDKPLARLLVVVTRGRGQAGSLTTALQRLGAGVIEMPVIEIADPTSWDELDQAIRLLAEGFFKWAIFTSANAVHKVFERLHRADLDSRAFGRSKVAAVGNATAGLLTRRGIRPDLVPPQFTGAAVAEALGRGSGRVFLPRAEGAPRELVEALTANGWSVREVAAYRNVPAGDDSAYPAAVVREGRFDVVTFTSASTVRNFVAIAGTEVRGHVACIGPVTADAARDAGLRVDVVAEEHTVPGLVRALVERFGREGADGTIGT
jgi:uroporphyrinogen III methyltransferase/synthase